MPTHSRPATSQRHSAAMCYQAEHNAFGGQHAVLCLMLALDTNRAHQCASMPCKAEQGSDRS